MISARLKRTAKFVAIAISRWTLLPAFKGTLSSATTIVLYHDISPERFEEHLLHYSTRYNIVSLAHYAELLKKSRLHELPPDSLVITIDDGWRGNYELLEVVRRKAVPVTIFLCAELVGTRRMIWNYTLDRTGAERALNTRLKATEVREKNAFLESHNGHRRDREYEKRTLLSKSEIAEMAEHFDFQSHGLYHEVLTMCSQEDRRDDMQRSKALLEELVGHEIFAFAYPYGRHDAHCTIDAREAGYAIARTSNIPELNSPQPLRFELRSIGIGDDASVATVRNTEDWARLRYLVVTALRHARRPFESRAGGNLR